MGSLPRLTRRQSLAGIVGVVVVGGLLFGAGFATARGLDDGSDSRPADADGPARDAVIGPPGTSTGAVPGPAVSGFGTRPSALDGNAAGEDARVAGAPGFGLTVPYGCPATLPPVLAGSLVDVSLASFDLGLLGDGFVLRSFSVRAEADCDPDGEMVEGRPVVETGWFHPETGLEVYVTQRVATEAVANVFSQNSGQAWAGGYVFTAWVNAYPVYPLDDVVREEGASDEEAGRVLRAALSQLAPSVADRCYYEQRAGSWDDLAAMGIGDPRPALPGNVVEQYAEFVAFNAPPADCNAVALEGATSFSASFASGQDSKDGVYVYFGAYPLGEGGEPGYGYLNEGDAYWSNGRYNFNVSAYGPSGPLGREAIEAIARAMDPSFSDACFIRTRVLTDADLAAVGLRAPSADGLTIVKSSLSVSEAPGDGCGERPEAEYYPQYNLAWSLEGDGVFVEVYAYRYGSSPDLQGAGSIYESGLNWTSADGTQYSVSGYRADRGGSVERETLIAVALSVDPDLDVDGLQEGPIALPAEKRDGAAD